MMDATCILGDREHLAMRIDGTEIILWVDIHTLDNLNRGNWLQSFLLEQLGDSLDDGDIVVRSIGINEMFIVVVIHKFLDERMVRFTTKAQPKIHIKGHIRFGFSFAPHEWSSCNDVIHGFNHFDICIEVNTTKVIQNPHPRIIAHECILLGLVRLSHIGDAVHIKIRLVPLLDFMVIQRRPNLGNGLPPNQQ